MKVTIKAVLIEVSEERYYVHNGAAMVIVRKSYRYKEKVPKVLRENFVEDEVSFNKKNEWSKWNYINKIIIRKVGENPGLWLRNRKKILGLR